MRTYIASTYFSLAALLGLSFAEIEIIGVNDLPVSTPSRFEILQNKNFPSLFSTTVNINFATNIYEISTLLLPSDGEEGIPFSVSYSSPLHQIEDIGQFIIKAEEDEAIPVSEFEPDGWQMNFMPLRVDKNVPSLAIKLIAVSPEGLHYSNNPLIPCSTGRGGGISCTMQTVPLRSVGERVENDEPLEENVPIKDDEVED